MPAPTFTPAPTPTATPTFTALQNQLGAGANLSGRQHLRRGGRSAAVAEVDRGNAMALAGLKAALDGQGVAAVLDPRTRLAIELIAAPQPAAETAASSVWSKLINYGSTVAASLFAGGVGRSAGKCSPLAARRAAPVVGDAHTALVCRPTVERASSIGEFINGLGDDSSNMPKYFADAGVA